MLTYLVLLAPHPGHLHPSPSKPQRPHPSLPMTGTTVNTRGRTFHRRCDDTTPEMGFEAEIWASIVSVVVFGLPTARLITEFVA